MHTITIKQMISFSKGNNSISEYSEPFLCSQPPSFMCLLSLPVNQFLLLCMHACIILRCQSQLYKCQSIRTWAGPRLAKIFFYYCACQSKSMTRLIYTFTYSKAIWWEYYKSHSWYHHALLVSWSYFNTGRVKPEQPLWFYRREPARQVYSNNNV